MTSRTPTRRGWWFLHPRLTHKRGDAASAAMGFARLATDQRGTGHRVHRNMVVFLAADVSRMEELQTAVRDFLGWSHVLENADELDLTQNQKNQATDKRRQADETVDARLLGAYHWALVPEAPDPGSPFVITATKAEGQSPSLAERVSRRLGTDGVLATQQAAAIRLWLDRLPKLWEPGHVPVGELWRQYTTYPYMPRLRDRSVLVRGIADQPTPWEREGFAVALAYDGERYRGLRLPSDGDFGQITDSMLVVRPEAAPAQRDLEAAAGSTQEHETVPDTSKSSGASGGQAPPMPPSSAAPRVDYFFGTKTLDETHYAMDFKKLMDEVLQHLASAPGVRLNVRVEIEAESPDGFNEFQVRTVSENSTSLKFDQAGFERGR